MAKSFKNNGLEKIPDRSRSIIFLGTVHRIISSEELSNNLTAGDPESNKQLLEKYEEIFSDPESLVEEAEKISDICDALCIPTNDVYLKSIGKWEHLLNQ